MANISKNMLAFMIVVVITISLVSTALMLSGGMPINIFKKPPGSGTVRLSILGYESQEPVSRAGAVKLIILPPE